MKGKKISFLFGSLFVLATIACTSRDAELVSFMTELNAVTKDIEEKINAGDLDGAKTAFDAKKEGLKAQRSSLQAARDSDFSDAARERLDKSFERNRAIMLNAFYKNMGKFASDQTKADKLKALITEYGQAFNMYLM